MSEKRALPKGWIWAKIGEICGINLRKPKGLIRAEEKKTTFIPMASVDGATGKAIAPMERPYEEVKKGYTFFAEGDVLFAKITPCMQNGKHFIATGLIDGIGFGSTEFHVLRVGESAMPEWLHYYIRQSHILKDATRYFTGTVGQQRIPDSFLKNLEIPLPPLAEQERIAGLLARQMAAVEKARKAAEEKLTAARLLPSAFLRDAFAQNKNLPNWKSTQLGDVILDIKDGGTPPRKNPDNFGGDVNWCVVKDIKPEIWGTRETLTPKGLQNCSAKVWPSDSVIISLGATIGNVGIARIPLATKQGLSGIIVDSKKILSKFLYYILLDNSEFIRSIASGTTFKEVRPPKLRTELRFPLPPLAEQKRIVDLLDRQTAAATKATCAAEGELREIRALPAALLRQAFAGAL